MASDTSAPVASGGSIDVLGWLRALPVAPEYHPTLAEFQDPIGYIFKIEKEASKYGICKIVPPVAPQSRKTTVSNLNKSLSARSSSGSPTFTTRQQQIGFCPRRHHPVQKPVWQSGEDYTVQEFEAKAKWFEKSYLRKCSKKNLSALEVETIYWRAIVDKPFTVEYANDMPGSAFAVRKAAKHGGEGTVADTEWNMRGVSRARGSLLKFMKEEIPGVTSPMVYLAMMFSWFAWHVEDHDFHSLNYLHLGSGKTWYGVPRDAAAAFEEVIRTHGYGGEINPLVTFSTLGEKTTVMSPEVLIDAGVPCCRLVQNAGEFVVTFPRAYHSGFSHGFNCGEAANICTPGWLTGAKEAAIRRASINYPPMVSHFQLLYDLALSSCSSEPKSTHLEPRSSRLKDKKRGEGEMLVKDLFVQDLLQNSNLLDLLSKGSSVIILPEKSLESGPSSKAGLQSHVERKKRDVKGRYSSLKQKLSPPCNDERPLGSGRGHEATISSQLKNRESGEDRPSRADRSSEQGLFSCVTCGILCFACVAVIKPTDVAARYLKTADCSQFRDWEIDNEALPISELGELAKSDSSPGWMNKSNQDGRLDVHVETTAPSEPTYANMGGFISNAEVQNGASSLGLLALAYGNSSDTEEDEGETTTNDETYQTTAIDCSAESGPNCDDTRSIVEEAGDIYVESRANINGADEVPLQMTCLDRGNTISATASSGHGSLEEDSCRFFSSMDSSNLTADILRNDMRSKDGSSFSSVAHKADKTITTAFEQLGNKFPRATGPDEDSSRMHVFCLQHAVQVERQLRTIGGAHVLLLCHPGYPELEAQAKRMAEEVGDDYDWDDISYRHASEEDEEIIQLALESEEAVHGNGDWAVKLGINLFYSANLSRSPLYSKQMPYNSIIYRAFGRNSPTNDPIDGESIGKVSGRQRKILVAGRWCGKVWMSNQIHPLLIQNDQQEEQRSTPSRVKPASKTMPSRVKPALKTNPPSVKPALRTTSSLVKPATRPVSKPDLRTALKPERPLGRSRSLTAETVAGKKRKATADIRPIVKAKSSKAVVQDEECEDLSFNHSFKLGKSCQRKRQMAKETPEARGVKNRSRLEDSESESEEEQEEKDGGPSTRLRKRPEKPTQDQKAKSVQSKPAPKKPPIGGKPKKTAAGSSSAKSKEEKAEYPCDIEGCTMSFGTKQELVLHKRNTCPVKSCGKKFFSHKYLVQHRRVHMDDRPLKCPWKGCKMSFKWAWARTEHIRVHTGARPYVCSEAGCGQTFRFVSDFSRHKRKTGHCANKKGRG